MSERRRVVWNIHPDFSPSDTTIQTQKNKQAHACACSYCPFPTSSMSRFREAHGSGCLNSLRKSLSRCKFSSSTDSTYEIPCSPHSLSMSSRRRRLRIFHPFVIACRSIATKRRDSQEVDSMVLVFFVTLYTPQP